ncbi:MAG: hypothetical protein AB8B65_01020 [Kordia sp.]|uniref:hypothetical protein n=1 Tax=Kordia sp. TaxID=1965332 RepID=UPI003859DFC5
MAFSKVPANVRFSQNYTLTFTDSLAIPRPQNVPSYDPGLAHIVENDSIYYFIDLQRNIIKVNLATSAVNLLQLPLQKGTGDVLSFCHPSREKFILIQDFPVRLLILGDTKITYHSLPNINFPSTNTAFNTLSKTLKKGAVNFIIDYGNLHYDSTKNQLHIGLQPLNAYDSEGFEDFGRIGIFDLSSLKWISTYALPEGMLKYKGRKTYSYLLSKKNMLFKNDTMFVSYVNDHFVYYYKEGKYLGKFPHISTSSKDMFLPVDLEDARDVEKMKAYEYAAPYYGAYNYHEKLKLYSRIYYDQQEALESSGKYRPPYLQRSIHAVFLDEHFNHVGEYTFPLGSLEFESLIAVSDGFLLYSTKYTNTDPTQQYFQLKYKYTITPKDNDTKKEIK